MSVVQTIEKAHNDYINYVQVKDDNNFITCSDDKSLKLWIKKKKEFIICKNINNAHKSRIIKVIYFSKDNLISCSSNEIKIWKENNNNNYDNIIILKDNFIESILFLEDKNILISCGIEGTKLWNLNENTINYDNISCIQHFKEVKCYWNEGLCRLDEDRIIFGEKYSLKVISILNKIIIKGINNPFECKGIKLIKNKGIFLIGGLSKDIRVCRSDNYQCIRIIKNAHDHFIFGFVELKDGSIVSYSDDKIKIWK